jgi:hypothetical protein
MEGLLPVEGRRELVVEKTDCRESLKQKTVDAEERDRERRKKRKTSTRGDFDKTKSLELRHVIDMTL